MLDRAARRRIARRARKLARSTFGYELGATGLCLPLAWATCVVAKQAGLHLRMYAGSAHWPRAEGWSFGYEWEGPSPSNVDRLSRGLLPELHVWAGDPAAEEWVDLSTPEWPDQCVRRAGLTWEAPAPPDFLWCSIYQLPRGVRYEPSAQAGQVAVAFLEDQLLAHA